MTKRKMKTRTPHTLVSVLCARTFSVCCFFFFFFSLCSENWCTKSNKRKKDFCGPWCKYETDDLSVFSSPFPFVDLVVTRRYYNNNNNSFFLFFSFVCFHFLWRYGYCFEHASTLWVQLCSTHNRTIFRRTAAAKHIPIRRYSIEYNRMVCVENTYAFPMQMKKG